MTSEHAESLNTITVGHGTLQQFIPHQPNPAASNVNPGVNMAVSPSQYPYNGYGPDTPNLNGGIGGPRIMGGGLTNHGYARDNMG